MIMIFLRIQAPPLIALRLEININADTKILFSSGWEGKLDAILRLADDGLRVETLACFKL